MKMIEVSYSFLNFCRINIFPLLLKLFLHGQFTKDITHLFILLSPRSFASLRHQFQSCSLSRHFSLAVAVSCYVLDLRSIFWHLLLYFLFLGVISLFADFHNPLLLCSPTSSSRDALLKHSASFLSCS